MTARSFGFRGQDGFVLGNALAHFDQFLEDLVGRKLGEAIELQFEDGVDLPIAQASVRAPAPVTMPCVELDERCLWTGKSGGDFPVLPRAIRIRE